jgi:hypothetical protein
MKPPNASQPKGLGRRTPPVRIPQIPMEWMDPMSWRLPSGKALAEFALQAGFLAPLLLGTPNFKKRKLAPAAANAEVMRAGAEVMRSGLEERVAEAPEDSGSFRDSSGNASQETR